MPLSNNSSWHYVVEEDQEQQQPPMEMTYVEHYNMSTELKSFDDSNGNNSNVSYTVEYAYARPFSSTQVIAIVGNNKDTAAIANADAAEEEKR